MLIGRGADDRLFGGRDDDELFGDNDIVVDAQGNPTDMAGAGCESGSFGGTDQ